MRLENTKWVKWLTGSVNKWFTIGLRYTDKIIEELKAKVDFPITFNEKEIALAKEFFNGLPKEVSHPQEM